MDLNQRSLLTGDGQLGRISFSFIFVIIIFLTVIIPFYFPGFPPNFQIFLLVVIFHAKYCEFTVGIPHIL